MTDSRLAAWLNRKRYDAGYADAVNQVRTALADPTIQQVTMDRAEGESPRAQGWNAAMADLTLRVIRRLHDAAEGDAG